MAEYSNRHQPEQGCHALAVASPATTSWGGRNVLDSLKPHRSEYVTGLLAQSHRYLLFGPSSQKSYGQISGHDFLRVLPADTQSSIYSAAFLKANALKMIFRALTIDRLLGGTILWEGIHAGRPPGNGWACMQPYHEAVVNGTPKPPTNPSMPKQSR